MTELQTPLPICIGTEAKTEVMRYVLQHSILEHASRPVQFIPMIGPMWEYSTEGIPVGTGFSLRRWMIPSLMDWKGLAVYLDADQLVLGDIFEIVDGLVESGLSVAMTKQSMPWSRGPIFNSSVMVINCGQLREEARKSATDEIDFWCQDELLAYLRNASVEQYRRVMYPDWIRPEPYILPNIWNSLDVYSPGITKLIHFTDENSQPPYNPKHRYARVWQEALCKAINVGAMPREVWDDAVGLWTAPRLDKRANQGLHPYYHVFWRDCSRRDG